MTREGSLWVPCPPCFTTRVVPRIVLKSLIEHLKEQGYLKVGEEGKQTGSDRPRRLWPAWSPHASHLSSSINREYYQLLVPLF